MPLDARTDTANRIARNMVDLNASALIADGQEAADDMVRALAKLRACGVSRYYLQDTVTGLLDELDNIQHAADTQLDDAGLTSIYRVDKSEVEALLAMVRR
jgi:hypothetical protein